MPNFRMVKKLCEETFTEMWCVERLDGRSFRDGVMSYNFTYNEQGAMAAIECVNLLEKESEK